MTTNDLGRPGYRGVVSKDAQTIAEVLQPTGYRSFMSGKWHMGTPDPTQHGFEEMYGTSVSAKRFFDPDHMIRFPEGRKRIQYPEGQFYATDAVTDHALQFLNLARQTPDKPWFLYLAYNAPTSLHAPSKEIAKYKGRYLGGWGPTPRRTPKKDEENGHRPPTHPTLQTIPLAQLRRNQSWNEPCMGHPRHRQLDLARRMAIYAAMIDRIHQQIGRILEDLKCKGEFENTLIMFTSDNGACFEWDPFGFDIKSSNQDIPPQRQDAR